MILKSPPTTAAIIGLKPFAPFIHLIWDKKCRIYFIKSFCAYKAENKFVWIKNKLVDNKKIIIWIYLLHSSNFQDLSFGPV
jgi:hypothetical protein